MRLFRLLVLLCIIAASAGTSLADTLNLTFDEGGHVSFTANGVTINPTSSGFDSMGTTLSYTLPAGYSFNTNFDLGQGRSDWILTEPGTNVVSDVIIFIGNTIDVYNSWAGGNKNSNLPTASGSLAQLYYTPNQNGVFVNNTASDASTLQSDLEGQNTIASSIWFKNGLIFSEQAGVNSYTRILSPGDAGFISSDHSTITSTTVTFVDAVPLPSAAAAGFALFGVLGGTRLLRRMKLAALKLA